MSKAEEAALAAANAVLEEDSVEAEETPSEPTEEAVAETPQETAEEVPEDIQAIWDEPDFEEEADAELAAEEPQEEEYEYDETSPEVAEERKKRIVAEKKAAWLEAQRVRENSGKWRAEALKFAPYCEPLIDSIEATSRRAYLREAKRLNDLLQPWAEAKYAKPDAEREAALRAELEATIRKEYEEQGWGKITAGPGEVPAEMAEKKEKLEKLLAARAPLEKIILARKELGEFDNL